MQKNQDKPQINLPFAGGKEDIGEWAYDHRFALMVTFLAALIILFSALYITISIEYSAPYDAILIELETEIEELKQQKEKLEQTQKIEYAKVDNLISNQNAEGLNANLPDAQNTQAQQIYDQVEAMELKARANREMYERGLAEDAAILARKDEKVEQIEVQNVKIDGMVTVSFSFVNPIRNSVNLTVPAYMCEGGGKVVVDAVLNRSGQVISASINKSTTTTDNCMIQTAISAARSSRFELHAKAAEKHSGQITYIFIPQ